MKFDILISGEDSILDHRKILQDKYVTAFTNIQNLKVLIKEINKDLKTPEEIKELDNNINEGDKSLIGERDKQKQMSVIRDEHNTQISANESAIKMYKNNITFLNKQLGQL